MITLGVHGFGFPDPGSYGDPAPALYQEWAAMLARPILPFGWYSATVDVAGECRAIERGYIDAYAYAYKELAPAAAQRLADLLAANGPADIVCHSLGSRVALLAAHLAAPGLVRRVLILDGAEIQPQAPAALAAGVSVLNAVVGSDLVLSELGARFNGVAVAPCVGQAGLGRLMPGWLDIMLDAPETAALALSSQGWHIGASPRHQLFTGRPLEDLRNRGNHWASYSSGGASPDVGNHPLFRAFLDGHDLSAFRMT